jgi:mannose-6-phosphate isomerase-like protein (cupin superfamily)
MQKVNLTEAFERFQEQWSPKIIGDVNDCQVKVVKVRGEFVWHSHEAEDELFMVVKGRFTLRFRDREEELEEGELMIVPRGVEHQPTAEEEAWLLVFEPATTLNTGDAGGDRTVDEPERLY